MQDLIFFYPPGSLLTLEVSTSTIKKFYQKYINESNFEKNSSGLYKYFFQIEIQKCNKGEYYKPDIFKYLIFLSFLCFLTFVDVKFAVLALILC